MRVWVDFTNTAHVVVLRPLVEELVARGHDVTLTARPLSHTFELLDDWGYPYTPLGRYGGAARVGKARAAAGRLGRMVAFGRGRSFDYAVAHGSTDALGFHAVEERHYVTDIHATVLHQLGLDPRRLEVPGQKRLEIDFGKPIHQIIA